MTHPPVFCRNNPSRQGFSLIELAIVLVIIGLLTGGVLLGKNLIRNADLQTVITDFTQYKSAANQFKDKYLALPGDFNEATALWGEDAAACNTAAADGTPGTCNGNGSGAANPATAVGGTGEIFQFWKQLQLEGLIQGNYTGLNGATTGCNVNFCVIVGQNVPEAGLESAGWLLYYDGNQSGNTTWFDGAYGHALRLGGQASLTWNSTNVLTAKELWSIDTKMDDGRPAYGTVRSYSGTLRPDCATSDTEATAEYELTLSTKGCVGVFITGF